MSKFSPAEIEKWVRPLRAQAAARVRLYMLPFAGGGLAAYQAWPAGLGPEVEVCPVRLPGRESRFNEPCHVRLKPLADLLARIVTQESRRPGARPFAVFGHSMGAALAYELTRSLSPDVMESMRCLIVSGRNAPTVPSVRPDLHLLGDGALVAAMVERYNGIPQAVLAEPELLQLVLPTLRGDMELIETYRYEPGPPLGVDLVALGGTDDESVSRSGLGAWAERTRGKFEMHFFDGGHFFIQTRGPEVFSRIRGCLGLA